MYEAGRKVPRETCASTPSPCSSPPTPTIDTEQADPQLADVTAFPGTLNSIGAWSAVRPAPRADAFQPCDLAPGVRSLDSKYRRMAIAPSPLPAPLDAPRSAPYHGGGGGALDPFSSSMAVPAGLRAGHPLAMANLPSDDGPDVDYSELDEAILRGRSTTLPNILAAPNPLYRFSSVAPGDAAPAAPIPASPASTSTLSMLSRHGSISVANSNRTVSPLGLSLTAIPIHQTASLDNHLASPREASGAAGRLDMLAGAGFLGKPGTAALSCSFSSTGSLAGNAAAPIRRLSEYAIDHPGSPLSLASLPVGPAAPAASDSGLRGGGALVGDSINTSGASHAASAAAHATRVGAVLQAANAVAPVTRCASFGPHLPTMREEDSGGDGASPSGAPGPADADAVLHFPPRVHSLKDMRRTSIDTGPDELAADALRQSASLSQLAGMAGLYRRHSLASTSLPAGAPPGMAGFAPLPREAMAGPMPRGMYHPAGDYPVYLPPPPPPPHAGMVYRPAPTLQPGIFHFGVYPDTMPRQNSTPPMPAAFPQPHLAAGMPYAGGPYSGLAPYMPMPPHELLLQQQPPAPALAPALAQPLPATQPGGQQQPHIHARRASHPGIPMPGPSAGTCGAAAAVPLLASGPHSASHTLLPNPATTLTPNMPFADMGKGLAYQSLPRGTRVFVVQFKGQRCDLFFAPRKGMGRRVIPTLASAPASQPAAAAAHKACARGKYGRGTHVLVEADRGVDLGVIKEQLATAEAVRSFSSALTDTAAASGGGGGGGSAGGDAEATDGKAGDGTASAKDVFVKRIFRVADQQEVADMLGNKIRDEQNALHLCQAKVQQRKLAMRVTDAEFQFDRRKLTFYFTASRRVDFRELVRDLFKHFKTRIWMCQLDG